MSKSTEKELSKIDYDHESRIVRLEVVIENINQTLIRIDKRLDRIEDRLERIEQSVWGNFKYLVTTMIGFSAIICTIMAKGFHWF
jgi:hypothetical protein